MVEFAGLNFQVETCSHYLGSFMGEATKRDIWILNDWVCIIKSLQMQHVPTTECIFCSPALSTTRMAVFTTHNTNGVFGKEAKKAL